MDNEKKNNRYLKIAFCVLLALVTVGFFYAAVVVLAVKEYGIFAVFLIMGILLSINTYWYYKSINYKIIHPRVNTEGEDPQLDKLYEN